MQFNGRLEMKATDVLMKERGLNPLGKVQKFIDQECIRLMAPYTPFRAGMLERSATLGTKIGSGEINQIAPYARYQYYGKLMVSSITGSAWARYGEKKVLTDKDLVHDKSRHPQAGPYWFERMKADHKEEILEGARKVAGAK
jgi:hypothetical protein